MKRKITRKEKRGIWQTSTSRRTVIFYLVTMKFYIDLIRVHF